MNRHDFRWALLALFGSGAAILGQQVLWTRRLTDLLGATTESSARVFGCFFFGLALGAAAAGLLLPRIRRPWRAAAWIELGIAALSLPIVLMPVWTGGIWPAVGPERLLGWQGSAIKSGFSLAVVLPPAFLMGMILPIMVTAVCVQRMVLSTHGILLYAVHTLGGAMGLALVVAWGLHVLGVSGSMLLVMGINLAVAALCFVRDFAPYESVGGPLDTGPRQVVPFDAGYPWLWLLVAFSSGAGIVAIEVLALGMLNLKAPLAFYPPAAVLFCVVLLLACSAAATPWLVRRLGGADAALPCCLAAAGLAIAAAPALFMIVTRSRSGMISAGFGLHGFLLRLGGMTCLSLGPALLAAGTVFPLVLCARGSAGGEQAGRRLGLVLAVNGVGGLIGAETAYRLALPALGVHAALGAVGGFYGIAAIVALGALKKRAAGQVAFPLAAMAGIAVLMAGVLPRLPLFFRADTFKVLEVRSGREGTLAVVERPDFGRGMFLDNQYMLGSTQAAPDMERQSHLPILLHPAPRRVGFIGLGTGITASGALRHKAVESITVLELSALVADAAAKHFYEFNQGVCRNPRVRLQIEDARAYLAAAKGRFDVIVGDLFTPWQPGEAGLCTLEQFQAAREALLPGGVFCQWLPMLQLTPQHFDTIAATFSHAFKEVHIFRNHLRAKSPQVALVGFRDGELDWNTAARRCEFERREGRIHDPVSTHPEGLALLYLGTYSPEGGRGERLNTLGNLRIELSAGRHLIEGKTSDYFNGSGDAWLAFLQRQVTGIERDRRMPGPLALLPRAGLLASRWGVAEEMNDPLAPAMRRELVQLLPAPIPADQVADWALWPGKPAGYGGK